MNLVDLVLRWAHERPNQPAIVEGQRIMTFAALEDGSARAAALLRRRGLGAGDAVLVFVPMGIDLYVLLCALWRIGAVALVVDPSAGPAHLAASVARCPPAAFVGTGLAQLLRWRHACLRRIPRAWSTGIPLGCRAWSDWQYEIPDRAIAPVPDDHPALITFTSGSTGQPKGAVRSHRFLAAQHAAVARSLDHRPGTADLATLPIFALANLASGQTVVVAAGNLRRPGAVEVDPIAAQIRRHAPRTAVASPAFFERLLATPDLGRLEALYTGGAPVFPDLLRRLQQTAPHTRIVAVYGSTEAEPIAEIAASDLTSDDWQAQAAGRGLLAGPPVAGLDLAILADTWGTPIPDLDDASFAAQRQPPGEPGEIVVAGDHVLPGYLGGVGDAETKFRVAGRPWHRTGDAGWIDGQGRLWLLGRCSAIIRDDQGVLHPFAVETAARAIPGVTRAAMTAWGGRRLLIIEGDADPAFVASTLTWARLDRVLVARIPLDRRHNAKVDYPALHRLLRRRLGEPHGQ